MIALMDLSETKYMARKDACHSLFVSTMLLVRHDCLMIQYVFTLLIILSVSRYHEVVWSLTLYQTTKFGPVPNWLVGWLVVLGFNATLTLSLTTNFRLFQTERVCRQLYQI